MRCIGRPHDFLARSTPQQQRGYYYTAQDLNEVRMEQAVQNELELERLRREAEEEEERQQLAASGGLHPVTETTEHVDHSQQRVAHLSGPVMVVRPTESETIPYHATRASRIQSPQPADPHATSSHNNNNNVNSRLPTSPPTQSNSHPLPSPLPTSGHPVCAVRTRRWPKSTCPK